MQTYDNIRGHGMFRNPEAVWNAGKQGVVWRRAESRGWNTEIQRTPDAVLRSVYFSLR